MLSWFVVISSHPSGSHLLNPPLQHEDGSALLSKRIKIWWENDQEWYSGTVEKFDSQSGKHTIAYDDGEKELLDLEEEKVSPSSSRLHLMISLSICSFKNQRREAQSDSVKSPR